MKTKTKMKTMTKMKTKTICTDLFGTLMMYNFSVFYNISRCPEKRSSPTKYEINKTRLIPRTSEYESRSICVQTVYKET